MTYFDILTLFPEVIEPYFQSSLLKRAGEKKLISHRVWNPRDFGIGKHRSVDAKPYGGGPGMVLMLEPLLKTLQRLRLKRGDKKTLVILFSAGGRQFRAADAAAYAKKYRRIIMLCGRYEGIDERIVAVMRNLKLEIKNLSIGPYVLTGGELPALVVADAVSRHVPGVLGRGESLEETRYGAGLPTYTRPEVFQWKGKRYSVPKVLLSGNHQKIDAWRAKHTLRP